METSSPYMESVCAARAMELSDEEALAGQTTISAETCGELQDSDAGTYIQENFATFLKYLRLLPRAEQDLLLGYYVLNRGQTSLAETNSLASQTMVSTRLRLAVKALLTLIMIDGYPTREKLEPVLVLHDIAELSMMKEDDRLGKEGTVTVLAADLILTYVETRSFSVTAERLGVWRPEVRRGLKTIADTLQAADAPLFRGLGCWLDLLTARMSAEGTGSTKRVRAKTGTATLTDPAILGEFRVSVEDPNYNVLFISAAQAS